MCCASAVHSSSTCWCAKAGQKRTVPADQLLKQCQPFILNPLLATGIVEVLSKLGVITATTKLAGSSSGALVTTSHCAGLPSAATYKAGLDLAHSCRDHMSCTGTLDRELRRVLHEVLPDGK